MSGANDAGRTHEESLARTFIVPFKRRRVASLLRVSKKRQKLLSTLYHYSDFDSRFVRRIPPDQQHAGIILELLLEMGAGPMCYAISADPDLDQITGPLADVLSDVVGSRPGTILSCVPGQLAYYEGEHRGDRCILAR